MIQRYSQNVLILHHQKQIESLVQTTIWLLILRGISVAEDPFYRHDPLFIAKILIYVLERNMRQMCVVE